MRSSPSAALVAILVSLALSAAASAAPLPRADFSASGLHPAQALPPAAKEPPPKSVDPVPAKPADKSGEKPTDKSADKAGDKSGKPASPTAAKKPGEKPGLAVAQPRSAAERDQALANLYAHLATADDEKQAKAITSSIEALWATPGSDTVSYLMQRAMGAVRANDTDLALKMYDAVVDLAPDYAEGWSQRAGAHIMKKDYERAMGDVRRTLALDPHHFRALDGLLHILHETGRKKDALKVGRQLLEVNPYQDGVSKLVEELARELEGRGI